MTNYTLIQNETITSYLSDKAFRLYSLLQSMAFGSEIQVYPSQKYMSIALRCSVKTIQRALKELKKANLISIRRRGSSSNLITLLQKKTTQAIEKVKDTVEHARKAYNEHKDYVKRHNKKESTFTNYSQRNYNFNKLEDLLLHHGKGDYKDCLLE